MMSERLMPVIIGCAALNDARGANPALASPIDLIARSGAAAIADAGNIPPDAFDVVALTRLFADTSPRFRSRLGASGNPPKSVADRLGLSPRRYLYAHGGGDMPQYLVSMLAEQVARGEVAAALIAGGDALRTQREAEGVLPDGAWDEHPGGTFETPGIDRPAYSPEEIRHGINTAIVGYPMIENALRAARGTSPASHQHDMARLLARFAAVARDNPVADRRERLTAEDIATLSPANRMISWPYPRLMNSNAYVDQAGALVLTSERQAREWGIPESRWVYLHGAASLNDRWHFSERAQLHRSPAIAAAVARALDLAQIDRSAISHFDIYSCFPCAVEIACHEIGLAEDDPRPPTVTGGLFFQGGPGNAYTMLSIAVMADRLRRDQRSFGLVTANGNILTKHSVGIYSTRRPARFAPPEIGDGQVAIDALPHVELDAAPAGHARVEAYTVLHDRTGPGGGVMIGRLLDRDMRFIARIDGGAAVLDQFERAEGVGRTGQVRATPEGNHFTPAE